MSGPHIDGTKFRVRGELKRDAVTIDLFLEQDVTTFGTHRLRVFNNDIVKKQLFQWPTMQWQLKNPTGRFTPGHPNEIWGGVLPQEWRARYIYEEKITDPSTWTLLKAYEYDVDDVFHDGDQARILSSHPLRRSFARAWTKDDHAPIVYDGSVSRTVTL